MSRWSARAEREGRWWVVRIAGVGATQGRTVREAQAMAVDLVRAVAGEDDPDVVVDFVVDGVDVTEEARLVREQMESAQRAQLAAGREQRSMVTRLLGFGLSGSDVASVLGVSPQRVSQLARGRR